MILSDAVDWIAKCRQSELQCIWVNKQTQNWAQKIWVRNSLPQRWSQFAETKLQVQGIQWSDEEING